MVTPVPWSYCLLRALLSIAYATSPGVARNAHRDMTNIRLSYDQYIPKELSPVKPKTMFPLP